MVTFGKLLGYWLERRELKPAAFAKRVGVTHTAVLQWLRDETSPRESRRGRIAEALDITLPGFYAAASKLESNETNSAGR